MEWNIACECEYCQADQHPRWQYLFDREVKFLLLIETIYGAAKFNKDYKTSDYIKNFMVKEGLWK